MSWEKLQQRVSRGRDMRLRNARVPACLINHGEPDGDGFVLTDLSLIGGRVYSRVRPSALPVEDLGGAIVWPGTVDCHTHIDKGQVWTRSANGDGSFDSALEAARSDRQTYHTLDDMLARAEFQLRCARAHGTVAMRSHVDAYPDDFDADFAALRELAEDCEDRIRLQLAPFAGLSSSPEFVEKLARAARVPQSGVLSLFLYSDPALEDFIDHVIGVAMKHDLALDFHVDENLEPESHCLRKLAEAVLRHDFQAPVLAGHACALSVQSPPELDKTLDLVAESGIGVVALPLCNAYLQDRAADRSPRFRGVAPVHEMRARGIPVAIASDNVRDGFYAYGDLDAAEVFRDALRMMQLDHPVGDWCSSVTSVAADLSGFPEAGRIAEGGPADLILFPARNWSEFAARPLGDRIVMRNGRMIDSTPPPYTELDHLESLATDGSGALR